MDTAPCSTLARLPCGENWRTRWRPPSELKPISFAAFGWFMWAMIPSSVKKSPTLLLSSFFSFFVIRLTATIWPSGKVPLYTSAWPPLPINLSTNDSIIVGKRKLGKVELLYHNRSRSINHKYGRRRSWLKWNYFVLNEVNLLIIRMPTHHIRPALIFRELKWKIKDGAFFARLHKRFRL